MTELKILEENIFQTLNEKRAVNYLSGCRRTTEGMFRFLLDESNIDYGDRLELGSFMKGILLKKITKDININSDINYVRLYGNRASHSGNVFLDHDIIVVNGSYKRIVLFFYEKLNTTVPKDIKRLINKLKIGSDNKRDIYIGDKSLFLETLISVEQSEDDYPMLGMNLISNISSKIIIDEAKRVPNFLFLENTNNLNLEKTILYIKKRNILSSERMSQLEALQTFFISSNQISREEKRLPQTTSEITETLESFTNWFYKVDTTKSLGMSRSTISNIIDVISLFAFVTTMFLGSLWFIKNGNVNDLPFMAVLGLGVSTFLVTFLYNLLYPYISLLQNRKLYSLSRSFTAITGAVGVSILGGVSSLILNDGERDGVHLPFFVGAIVWSVFIQLSLIVKSETNSKYDRAMRYISYVLLVIIIGLSIGFSTHYVR